MNTNAAIFTAFAVGLGVGGGGTYLVVKKRYRALADAEVASVKEVFANIRDISRTGSGGKGDEGPAPADEAVEPPKESAEHVPYNRIIQDNGYKSESALSDSEVDPRGPIVEVDIDPKSQEVEKVRVELPENHDPRYQQQAVLVADMYDQRGEGPYLINIAEFMGECENYGKVSLDWYSGDGTLVGEDERAIDDLRIIGGSKFFKAFGTDQHNEDTIYIRNDEQEVDYEILRKDMSYGSVALGAAFEAQYDNHEGRNAPRKMRGDG